MQRIRGKEEETVPKIVVGGHSEGSKRGGERSSSSGGVGGSGNGAVEGVVGGGERTTVGAAWAGSSYDDTKKAPTVLRFGTTPGTCNATMTTFNWGSNLGTEGKNTAKGSKMTKPMKGKGKQGSSSPGKSTPGKNTTSQVIPAHSKYQGRNYDPEHHLKKKGKGAKGKKDPPRSPLQWQKELHDPEW